MPHGTAFIITIIAVVYIISTMGEFSKLSSKLCLAGRPCMCLSNGRLSGCYGGGCTCRCSRKIKKRGRRSSQSGIGECILNGLQ
uniref:Uncharacterized protein n=1 Tax=Rhipicephalus zambeziensis TaxID=60191 RepID=A0A224YTF2_9ACAR